MEMVGKLDFEGIFASADVVLVGATLRIETGVLVGLHLKQIENDNLIGQKVIEFMNQLLTLFWREALFGIEMGIEVAGVHTCVCSAATGDGHALLMQQQREAGFQSFLYGGVLWLNLPTEKRRTVVCQVDKVAHKPIFQAAKVAKICYFCRIILKLINMKKSFVFCLCMAVVVLFSACNKDQDGVFNPAKKIQKIYTVEDGAQVLSEVWNWDGNLLTSIDLYEGGVLSSTTKFEYDGNRLITLRDGYSYATFNYDGKKIDYVNVYYTGYEDPLAVYSFEYNGKKLSQIKMVLDYSDIYGKKSLVNPLKYALPASCAVVENVVAQHVSEAKEATETITMKLTWTGNNVTAVEATEETSFLGYTQSVSDLSQCTFDNKENPIKGFISSLFAVTEVENLYCNKNNMLSITTSQNGVLYSSTTNVYEYEGDFPSKVTSTTTDNEGEVFVSSYVYEY